MATIYIETSVVSYLTANDSSQVVALSRQMLTRQWWNNGRLEHDLFSSQFVVDEASQGSEDHAKKRLDILSEIQMLDTSSSVFDLAKDLLDQSILPPKAELDALHISTAAVHSIEYLLTWNCKHIANAQSLPAVYRRIEKQGYAAPLICTIEEMIGDYEPFE